MGDYSAQSINAQPEYVSQIHLKETRPLILKCMAKLDWERKTSPFKKSLFTF